ncbi:MAG: hypothetical protein LBU12_00005 [Deltaproteobacteria bacterium]|jgi:predicted transposase/invertase (TIGR01784 family)|nr:hypothetical protein [Deltaproteobacteria bacterium]
MELGYTSLEEYALALGREEGLEEGREQGREETRFTIAKNLLAIGIPVDKITQATGLSEDKILFLSRQA